MAFLCVCVKGFILFDRFSFLVATAALRAIEESEDIVICYLQTVNYGLVKM